MTWNGQTNFSVALQEGEYQLFSLSAAVISLDITLKYILHCLHSIDSIVHMDKIKNGLLMNINFYIQYHHLLMESRGGQYHIHTVYYTFRTSVED